MDFYELHDAGRPTAGRRTAIDPTTVTSVAVMSRRVAAGLWLLLACLVGPAVRADAPPAAPQGDEKAPSVSTAEQRALDRRASVLDRVWWNQPTKIEQLALSESQRARMDAILRAFLDQRLSAGGAQKRALGALGEALVAGDADSARQAGDQIAEAVADPVRAQVDMMIEVLEILSPEQRQAIAERYPGLVSRLWIRSGNLRMGEAQRRSPKRGARN